MKNIKIGKIITLIVGVLMISIMFWSFNKNPPLPEGDLGWEYSNYRGSLSKHIFLVFIAFFFEKMLFFKLKLQYYFVSLFIVFLINLIWAFTNTIHQGSIAATYLIWSVFIFIYVIINSVIVRIRMRNK